MALAVLNRAELVAYLAKDVDRVSLLRRRLDYELTEHRCAYCFEPMIFDESKAPAVLRYACSHGPKDIGCQKLVADFRAADGS